MSRLYSNNLIAPSGSLKVGGALSQDTTKQYSGSWVLNSTAPAIPSGGPSNAIASAASQWTLIAAIPNANATSLLNSQGRLVAPVKGLWRATFAPYLTSTTNLQCWFVVITAAGQYTSRLGYASCGSTASSNIVIPITMECPLNIGDTVVPSVYFQDSNSTRSFGNGGDTASSTNGVDTPITTVLTFNLITPWN
jgi:hypothetical protein